MQTIELTTPLKVNGKDYKELKCDLDAVTVDDFAEAETRSASKKQGGGITVLESDYIFHMYLAFFGVTHAMPEVDMADLERLTGRDVVKAIGAGRFLLFDSGESTESDSGEQSENTATNTAAAPTK